MVKCSQKPKSDLIYAVKHRRYSLKTVEILRSSPDSSGNPKTAKFTGLMYFDKLNKIKERKPQHVGEKMQVCQKNQFFFGAFWEN